MRKTIPFLRRELPPLALVKQNLPNDRVADPRSETRERLLACGLREKVKPNARIAVTAGSRGTGGFVEIVSGIVDAIKACGGKPFIIPAMGSHGGAIAEGQKEILKRLGVTSKSVGAPVRATMETRALGTSETGADAHLDDFAAECDGIIVLGRTKTHPENTEGIASGLLKMTTIGLGKQTGAQGAHSHGLWDSVKAVPKLTIAKSPIICGVAVVENSYREPAIIEAVPASYEAFYDADMRLLEASKKYSSRLPFKQLDLLVVDELSKNISGTGMDTNVIGHWRMSGDERTPDFRRIAVLSLMKESLGNGLGIGFADFTTERFAREFDQGTTYVNLLTATEPDAMNTKEGLLPPALPTDREALEVALYAALARREPRVCRIKNTGLLGEFWASESLLEEARQHSNLSVVGKPEPLQFDGRGNLF